ncbi:hypothetical protein Tco_0201071 [Tanacetum coccineum]
MGGTLVRDLNSAAGRSGRPWMPCSHDWRSVFAKSPALVVVAFAFKALFFLQFFPRATRSLEDGVHSLRQGRVTIVLEYMYVSSALLVSWTGLCTDVPDIKSGDRYQSCHSADSITGGQTKNNRKGSDSRSGGGNSGCWNATKGTKVSIPPILPTLVPQQSQGYPRRVILTLICNTCGRRHPECRRAAKIRSVNALPLDMCAFDIILRTYFRKNFQGLPPFPMLSFNIELSS